MGLDKLLKYMEKFIVTFIVSIIMFLALVIILETPAYIAAISTMIIVLLTIISARLSGN